MIRQTVALVVRFAPFRSNCLPQALLAYRMCRFYRIPYAMHFGGALEASDERGNHLVMHAWVCCGSVAISGGSGFDRFAPVACFIPMRSVTKGPGENQPLRPIRRQRSYAIEADGGSAKKTLAHTGKGRPEFQLAVACAAWPPTEDQNQAIRKAVAAGIDWDLFTQITDYNRIGGIAEAALRRAGSAVPSAVLQQARDIAIAALRSAGETYQLQQSFAACRIPVAFLKGAAVAHTAFSNLSLRHSKDIDLLVAPEDVPAAWSVMENCGYHRIFPPLGLTNEEIERFRRWSKDSGFYHPDKRVCVELHWRLTSRAGLFETPDPTQWDSVEIAKDRAITTLSNSDQFIYLCIHGTTHAWKRLKWLADIGALLNHRPDAANGYWRETMAQPARTAMEVAMRLSSRLFSSRLPDDLPRRVSLRIRILMGLSLVAMNSGTRKNPIARALMFQFGERFAGLFLASDPKLIRLWIGEQYAPVEDRLILRLPRGLGWLHLILRVPLLVWKALPFYGLRAKVRAQSN